MSVQKEKKKNGTEEEDCGFNSLCIYGGTFDPVHTGHLIIAKFVREEIGADKILFVPSFLPPHKEKQSYAAYHHRYQMLMLAIHDSPDFMISNIEYEMQGTSYSYLTINEIKKRYQLTSETIYFLIGGDSLVNFHQWRKPAEILKSANVIVAGRPGFEYDSIEKEIYEKVNILKTPQFDISSTDIRKRIASGKNCRFLVPDPVLNYIHTNSLYR